MYQSWRIFLWWVSKYWRLLGLRSSTVGSSLPLQMSSSSSGTPYFTQTEALTVYSSPLFLSWLYLFALLFFPLSEKPFPSTLSAHTSYLSSVSFNSALCMKLPLTLRYQFLASPLSLQQSVGIDECLVQAPQALWEKAADWDASLSFEGLSLVGDSALQTRSCLTV